MMSRPLSCDDLVALLERPLLDARPDRRALQRHLRACSSCRARWPEILELFARLESVPGIEPPAWTPPARLALRSRRVARLAAAAALVLLALGAGWLLWPAPGTGRRDQARGAPASAAAHPAERTLTRPTEEPATFRRLPSSPAVLATVVHTREGIQITRTRSVVRAPGRFRLLGR